MSTRCSPFATRQASVDGWAEDSHALEWAIEDIRSVKRLLVIRRGAFPGPDDPEDPNWLRGAYAEAITLNLEEARFDMADLYFRALSQPVSPRQEVDYYLKVARSRLDRAEYDQIEPAVEAVFAKLPDDQTELSAYTWRALAELLADIARARQEVGLDDETVTALNIAGCRVLDSLMARGVAAFMSSRDEEFEGSWMKLEADTTNTLASMAESGCDKEWLAWIADPTLAGSASAKLVETLRALML
jgi:hypothetical protein